MYLNKLFMRKKYVAGNWKMNLNHSEALGLSEFVGSLESNASVLVFPPFIYLSEIKNRFPNLNVGAQNFHPKDKGAFTGEVSIEQLKNIGVTHVLIGHSERRQIFNESNEFIKEKVDAALSKGLTVVFCCGEPLEVREIGEEVHFVEQQLKESLFHLTEEQLKSIIVAYEPIWAIGTGVTASSEQAEQMHKSIRALIATNYSNVSANEVSILYGGSCNASNAKELFTCQNVDGGLIGGASLVSQDFSAIVNAI